MTRNLRKKIELSKILEDIEINKNSKKIINSLDDFHSKSKAHVIGITGPPGVGKSSMINNLIKSFRKKKFSVGVIAVDPSSNQSGGALLGDRARFSLDADDNETFVRSMATKNYLGGVSELTYPTMIVMRSIFDFLIIETVGVGQSETNIKDIVDTVVLCVQPGSGDTIQFMKSGVFEIPDIITVTKCDLEALSNLTLSELLGSKNYFKRSDDWDLNIFSISSHKKIGFNLLYEELQRRWLWLNENLQLKKNRKNQDIEWIKRNIFNEYGLNGLSSLEGSIDYDSKPFKKLNLIKEDLKNKK